MKLINFKYMETYFYVKLNCDNMKSFFSPKFTGCLLWYNFLTKAVIVWFAVMILEGKKVGIRRGMELEPIMIFAIFKIMECPFYSICIFDTPKSCWNRMKKKTTIVEHFLDNKFLSFFQYTISMLLVNFVASFFQGDEISM